MELDFIKNYKQFTFAQVDKDLRYTLIINPHQDFDPNLVLGKKDEDLARGDGINQLISLKKNVLLNGVDLRQVISFNLSNGIETYDILGQPIYDKNKSIVGVSTAALNITEHETNDQNKTTQDDQDNFYLKEIHHRVKNNLSHIEGFIHLQLTEQSNPEATAILKNTISRMRGIKSLYDILGTSDNFENVSMDQYLQKISSSVHKIYSSEKSINVDINCSNFYLPIKQATVIGIIVNELLTNAFKYAFKGSESGKIEIDLIKTEGRLMLTIHDDGIGIDENIIKKEKFGFGLKIIKGLLKNSELTISNNFGTRVMIKFENWLL